MKKGTIIAKKH